MAPIKVLALFRPHAFLLAASTLALTAATAAADGAAPAPFVIAPRTVAAAVPGGVLLKRLPAGQDGLTFRGEMASRRFAVALGRSEAARINTFQVALRNTVSLLPEHSAITISVNGRTLAAVPANAADKTMLVPIAVPAGLLVPGANTVQVTATLTHRVDCSVPATYELWATLDPSHTGFVVPDGAADQIAGVADLAAAPLAEDGTTRIWVRMREGADEAEIGQAARAVQTLVRRAKLVRPVVEVAPEAGRGPGLDLIVAGHEPEGFAPLAKTAGIGVGQDAGTGRIMVEVDPEADEAPRATPSVAAGVVEPPRDGFRKSFAQLGRNTEVFTGRRYEASLAVVLPPDFMSTNDRARLRLDGGHSATLVDGDGLALRVNGTLVSSVPLLARKAERFDHREVELPLRFFHPGRNDVTIEGTLSAEADAQCKTMTMPHEARLTIADTSELEFPGFAHLTTIPQIPAAMAARGDLPVYLPGSDRASMAAALTVLANLAASGSPAATLQVHLGIVDEDRPGLLVAAADQLPASISGALRSLTAPVAPAPASVDAANASAADTDAATGASETTPADATPQSVAPTRLGVLVDGVRAGLRSRGFFFGNDKADLLTLKSDDLLVAAVTPGGKAPRDSLDVMPRFTRDATHWLVVTASSPATLDGGLDRLAASGRWDQLRGEAVKFDPTSGEIEVRQPRGVTYVLPSEVVVADVRPILGGLMSDNILMSLAILFVVMGTLGVSTHALVRRMGAK
ncbi:cellulose biosynthesis cyclic di-GMP-binding regulatory protein BcsB [Lichenihabitans sp. Uapishka_5]|uniref:cellulose biosynthesis cyclic di-GMP-binding regulatory protein BcsB n=1 Tax=Lichenihabitans sp. Uapishka_5 TaxID=3037302 RepID=UPI0029E7F641|nr:cellulose biosynthesis cyclic di-GMP-binding regulatory protein BcsB [Lichenihabitans sp. Uapishka_5]MDX7949579.1 cellulose biosynthesis cyclic di-GMP-binding regulatory protein BcsB [Lichenihabitans sp. Uapishka_5]